MGKLWLVGQAIFFSNGRDGVGSVQFLSSLLKQISPFQTSTDKIIRHSEHNSVLYSATKGSSLVSLHLLFQGCDASIIMLSKRARLERQEHSFHTLTVYMKWSALIRILPKLWNIFTKVTYRPPSPKEQNESFIDSWCWRSFTTKSPPRICSNAVPCFYCFFYKLIRLHLLSDCSLD